MTPEKLMPWGTVIGYYPKSPDYVYVSNGLMTIIAYCPSTRAILGKSYMLYKINNTYHIGSEVAAV